MSTLFKKNKKVLIVSSLGGMLEFYDFIIFVSFSGPISKLFFSANYSVFLKLLFTYTIFAIGYAARPIAGIIFGHFADKVGRKKIFFITVIIMAISTLFIGLLPTYSTIGIMAPILLVFLRLCQGISLGGEIPGATAFVYEHMEKNKQALGISFLFSGIGGGILFGSLVSFSINAMFDQQTILNWGWRIPFLLGGLLGWVASYLRMQLFETPIFQQIKRKKNVLPNPIKNLLATSKKNLIFGTLIAFFFSTATMIFYIYMPVFLSLKLNYPPAQAFLANSIGLLLLAIFGVCGGFFAQKIDSKLIVGFGSLLLLFTCYPALQLIQTMNFYYLLLAYLLVSIPLGASLIYAVILCRSFPATVRVSAISICCNLAFVFAGFLPAILSVIEKITFSQIIPILFISLTVSLLCLIALIFISEYSESIHATENV